MILQNYWGFKIMAMIEIKALEELALTHEAENLGLLTFQRIMFRSYKSVYNKCQMTVLVRDLYDSFFDTV